MKKIIFYILVALLVVTVGCNDDDNSLPVILTSSLKKCSFYN